MVLVSRHNLLLPRHTTTQVKPPLKVKATISVGRTINQHSRRTRGTGRHNLTTAKQTSGHSRITQLTVRKRILRSHISNGNMISIFNSSKRSNSFHFPTVTLFLTIKSVNRNNTNNPSVRRHRTYRVRNQNHHRQRPRSRADVSQRVINLIQQRRRVHNLPNRRPRSSRQNHLPGRAHRHCTTVQFTNHAPRRCLIHPLQHPSIHKRHHTRSSNNHHRYHHSRLGRRRNLPSTHLIRGLVNRTPPGHGRINSANTYSNLLHDNHVDNRRHTPQRPNFRILHNRRTQ